MTTAQAQGVVEIESKEQLDRDINTLVVPIIVFFTAPSCHACHQLEPFLDRIAKKGVPLNETQTSFLTVAVRKINVEQFPQIASVHGVRSLPTCLFVYQGGIFSSHVGTMNESKLLEIIKSRRQ